MYCCTDNTSNTILQLLPVLKLTLSRNTYYLILSDQNTLSLLILVHETCILVPWKKLISFGLGFSHLSFLRDTVHLWGIGLVYLMLKCWQNSSAFPTNFQEVIGNRPKGQISHTSLHFAFFPNWRFRLLIGPAHFTRCCHLFHILHTTEVMPWTWQRWQNLLKW